MKLGQFSGEAIQKARRLAADKMDFSESDADALDFARCQRPDGSFYGTGGQCRKGKKVDAKEKAEKKPKAAKEKRISTDSGIPIDATNPGSRHVINIADVNGSWYEQLEESWKDGGDYDWAHKGLLQDPDGENIKYDDVWLGAKALAARDKWGEEAMGGKGNSPALPTKADLPKAKGEEADRQFAQLLAAEKGRGENINYQMRDKLLNKAAEMYAKPKMEEGMDWSSWGMYVDEIGPSGVKEIKNVVEKNDKGTSAKWFAQILRENVSFNTADTLNKVNRLNESGKISDGVYRQITEDAAAKIIPIIAKRSGWNAPQ